MGDQIWNQIEDRLIRESSWWDLLSVDILKVTVRHLLDFLKVLNHFPLTLNLLYCFIVLTSFRFFMEEVYVFIPDL